MSNITLDKLFDLLLENIPVGEMVDVKLQVRKNIKGGWNIEYSLPPHYKIEPKKDIGDE